MKNYLSQARLLGFSEAVFLSDLLIECRTELRAYCNPQQCPNHGENWVCPPGCGSLEACRERVKEFHEGILLQSITKLTPPVKPERYKMLNREHNFRFKRFIEIIKMKAAKILPLSTGGCVFCERCSYPEPCIYPEVKMESLSAFGIDVAKLCETADIPFSFREDIVYFTALLLFVS